MNFLIKIISTLIIMINIVPLELLNANPFNSIEVEASGTYEPLIAGGYDFSIARLSDGTFWAWGANERGQLGLGDYENRLHPVKLNTELEDKDVVELKVIDDTVIAHLRNGDYYTWGRSVNGIGGGNSPVKRYNSKSIGYSWTTRAANRHDSLSYIEDGNVYVSGSGHYGQFGRGIRGYGSSENNNTGYYRNERSSKAVLIDADIVNFENSVYKKAVNGKRLEDVRLVAGSDSSLAHLAVTSNNEIFTWGNGYSDFAVKNKNNNIKDNIVSVDFGVNMYALTDKNEVWEWRYSQGSPAKLDINDIVEVDVYGGTVLLRNSKGDVFARGSNSYGEIGEGISSSFTNIASNIKTMSAGYRHTLFITNNDEVYGMGWNAYRQLGDTDDGTLERFEKIDTISNVDNILSTLNSSFATKGRDLYGWGELSGSTFGATTNNPRKAHTFNSNIKHIEGSPSSIYRLFSITTQNGELYTTGNNYRTALGRGGSAYTIGKISHSNDASAYRENVANGKRYVLPRLDINSSEIDIIKGSQGGWAGLAVDTEGNLLTWGHSSSGQWGIGEIHYRDWGSSGVSQKPTEAFVKAKTNVKFKDISGGNNTKIALSRDDNVYSFGENNSGSIGRSGPAGYNFTPGRVDNLSNITSISMGSHTGLALDTNGNIYSWGYNNLGQIGNGSVNNVHTPTNITNEINDRFRYIHSGLNSMFAVNEDGDLYAWGNNRYGQLGLGDRFNRTSPRKVAKFPYPVKQVSSAGEHTMVLLDNGDVYVAGSDGYGQLGRSLPNNSLSYRSIPFPDYVTLDTKDNQELDLDGYLTLSGNVTSVVPGSSLKLEYSVRDPNGEIESGIIKEYTSKTTPESFYKEIHLDSKYTLGGYSAEVTIEDVNSGINNSSSINFGLLDTTPPTSPKVNVGNSSWTKDNVSVSITPGVDHGSGVDSTEYRVNSDEWKVYSNPFEVSREGESTIEARTFDRSGNVSPSAFGRTKVDKSPPKITFSPSTDKHTHEDVILNIRVEDKYSGVKSIMYNGKPYDGKPIIVKRNSSHIIEAVDNLENKSKDSYVVSNIDKSISFIKPTLSGFGDMSLDEESKSANLSPLIVNDWRDESNSWNVRVSASQLKMGEEVLERGLMTLRAIDVNGQQSSPKNKMYKRVSIDGVERELSTSNITRGKSEVNLDDLIINVDPTQMKVGKYKSTITWSLTHAP